MSQTIQLAVHKNNVNLVNQVLNSNQPTKIAAEEGMKISLVEAKTGQPLPCQSRSTKMHILTISYTR